jgi:poly(3-hydroxybutyrate) depolymerase
LYVPSSWKAGGPGVVALHGNGDTAANFLASQGLRSGADAQGVAIAAPQALSGHANGLDWDAYSTSPSNIDLAVTRTARETLQSGGVDPKRTYMLGYSQGGFLSYLASMVDSQHYGAGHVAAAGSPLGPGKLEPQAARKIPMDILVGANDSLKSVAKSSADALQSSGFEVRYTELAGVGHCCPLTTQVPSVLAWLVARSL